MPIGIDSQQTVDAYLRTDMGRPEAERPVFRLRFLTPRQERKVEKLIDEANAAKDRDGRTAKILDAIRIGLSGWDRLKDEAGAEVPYAPEAVPVLADLLQFLELGDLAWQCIDTPALKARDFFVSGWPWESRSGASAAAAGTADATSAPTT